MIYYIRQETAKFMYKFIHKQLSLQFYNYFDRVVAINKRSMRASQKKNRHYISRFHANRSQRSIKYRGEGLKYGTIYLMKFKATTLIFQLLKRIHKNI